MEPSLTWYSSIGPAQPVNGVLLTDLLQYDPRQWPAGRTQMTYPESLSRMAEGLRRTPESVSWAEVFQFVAPFDTTKATERQAMIQSLRAVSEELKSAEPELWIRLVRAPKLIDCIRSDAVHRDDLQSRKPFDELV